MPLFAVRSVIKFGDLYEERVVVFSEATFEAALHRAASESQEYVDSLGAGQVLGLQQAYQLDTAEIGDGTEVFSLMRRSPVEAEAYISRHFDTGTEREGHV